MDWWQPFVLTVVVALNAQEGAHKPPSPPPPPKDEITTPFRVPASAP